MADTLTRIDAKARQIADEAVGQARGATPTLKSWLEDWVAGAEASIGKTRCPPRSSPALSALVLPRLCAFAEKGRSGSQSGP
jgi:predicted double-glycine peptidase